MGNVYVQTNEPENRVLAFRREADGSLTAAGEQLTGGAGDGIPHLTSQGSVVLAGDGSRLLVTNTASGDVSVFAVGMDGLELVQTVPTGAAPKSVAEHDGLVYVLNTGEPSLSGFRLGASGLEPLAGSRRELAAGADPAQAGFAPDGSVLVVTERGTDAVVVYPVGTDGLLGEPQGLDQVVLASAERAEVVIDFGGPDSAFQMRFGAFYADCPHDVLPVRNGFRLCLVYNLTLEK